jgi:hypothetical protein
MAFLTEDKKGRELFRIGKRIEETKRHLNVKRAEKTHAEG